MTSEIALMNQRAVALAADSAVTMIDGGKVVGRNDWRKVFNLAEGLPVGLMFFGVADLMGHPWEDLLGHFQNRIGPAVRPHVRDYAVAFTGMLDNLETFFPLERQDDEYRRLLASVYRFIFKLAHYLRESGASGADEQILEQAIGLVWQRYQTNEDGTPRRDLGCFPAGFGATVERDHARAITELIHYAFSPFVLDARARDQLREIAVLCVTKDLFLEDVTGLVFAGYGASEHHPAVVTYHLSAVVGGIVKRARADETAIDSQMHSSITLFADCEATYGFLRGIAFDLEARIYGTMDILGRNLIDQVVDSFTAVDQAQRESVRRQFQSERLPGQLQDVLERINQYQEDHYIDPILSVLERSPNDDLAAIAEQFVALNVFKKRVMAQRQTVGGAIDVALISRESGFTWWKRQGG